MIIMMTNERTNERVGYGSYIQPSLSIYNSAKMIRCTPLRCATKSHGIATLVYAVCHFSCVVMWCLESKLFTFEAKECELAS